MNDDDRIRKHYEQVESDEELALGLFMVIMVFVALVLFALNSGWGG